MLTIPSLDIHKMRPHHAAQVESIIQEYEPFVQYLAQQIACQLPSFIFLEDLMSAGFIGLLDALAKYDPQRANTFKTYAEFRIRGAMLDDLRRLDWVPRSVREKERALARAYEELERRLGRPATDEEVAAFLDLDLDEFYCWQTQMRGASLLRLNTSKEPASNGDTSNCLDTLPAEAALRPLQVAQRQYLKALLTRAIAALPWREKVVIVLYYYEELTLKEIGKLLELTESRISQLRIKAICHLRMMLQNRKQSEYTTIGSL